MIRKDILEKIEMVENGKLSISDFKKQVSTVRGKQFSEEKVKSGILETGKMYFVSGNGKVYSLPLQKATTKGNAFLEPYYRIQNGKLLSTLQK